VALAGLRRSRVRVRQFLRSLEAVLDGCAGGGQGLVSLALGGCGLAGPGGFVSGDDDGVAGAGVQAGEAGVGEGAEPGCAEPLCEVVTAGGGDLAGGAAVSWGDPGQVAVLVGEGEEQQPMFLMLAVEIPPVRGAGPAAGGDQGAIEQHDLPALLRDLGEGAVQAGCAGGEQPDDFSGPAVDGGGGDAVAASSDR